MKRWFLLMMAVLFLAGCASARESGYYEHNTLYKNWDHMKFSWGDYKNADQKDGQKSKDEGWWGVTVQVPRE
jgi:uncharacterized protein YcfL